MWCGVVGAILVAAGAPPLSLILLAVNDVRKVLQDRDFVPTDTHEERVQRVLQHVRENGIGNKIQKASNSNRFEYGNLLLTWVGLINSKSKLLPLGALRNVLHIDSENKVVTVEGACTMKSLADALVPKGLMLPIHPEMHEITVGGAIAGIGIEAAGHKHGFFHDNLLEVDVLCADGKVRTASATNDHKDLFAALPNSYATLGYILKAKLHLAPAAPYVHMKNRVYTSLKNLLRDMAAAAETKEDDFLEALVFNESHMVLSQSKLEHGTPAVIHDIYHNQYHHLVQQNSDLHLVMQDYMFRFEPDLFFNWHDIAFHRFLRWALPPSLRNSRVYRAFFGIEAKVDFVKDRLLGKPEPLIQDWEVPWPSAHDFLHETFSRVRLPEGKAWLILPIRPKTFPTNYPLQDTLYMNLGVYLKDAGLDDGRNGGFGRTRAIDGFAFKHGGTKMLYSTSFLTEGEYVERFNGKAYEQIKAKYDPAGTFKTIFQKCFNNAYS